MSVRSKVRKFLAPEAPVQEQSEQKPEPKDPKVPFGRDKFGAPKSRG